MSQEDLEAFALRQEEAGRPALAKKIRRIAKDMDRKKSAAERTIPMFAEPTPASARRGLQLGLPIALGTSADQLSLLKEDMLARGHEALNRARRKAR